MAYSIPAACSWSRTCCVLAPQYILLLTMRSKYAEKAEIKKKVAPKLDSNSVPPLVTACKPSALPSEGVYWVAHACMASVD